MPCGMRALHAVHLEKFDRAISIVVVGMVRSLCRAPCTGVGVASMSVVASSDGSVGGCGGGVGGVLGAVGRVVVGGCCCWVALAVLGAVSVGGTLAVLEGPLPVVFNLTLSYRYTIRAPNTDRMQHARECRPGAVQLVHSV